MPPRSIYEIAKEIAADAVSVAQRAGYEVRPERATFFVSDRMDLEAEIVRWIEDHMRLERH